MRTTFLHCNVDNLSMDESVRCVEEFVRSGNPHQHVVINVDKVIRTARDASLRAIVNNCDLINVDGMPIVWMSYLLGHPIKQRVTGIDLFERLLERAAFHGWGVFFLGAKEPVVQKAVSAATERWPGLRIVGFRNGYWESDKEEEVVADVKRSGAQLLFVAISSPKKEQFLGRYSGDLGTSFSMGVGGSFDVLAGVVRRAPQWMRSIGFEWLYRFLQEPKRMFRRYFIEGPYFFWLVAREIISRQQ